jgi:hypothetical protein
MEIEGTTLASSKQEKEMPKMEKQVKVKKRKKQEDVKVEVSTSYLQALEEMIAEQRLRVLLYQQVIIKASEELGVDILKKVGSQRSGP